MIRLPVRYGENDSEIVDVDGALVCYVHGTAIVSRKETGKQIIESLNLVDSPKASGYKLGIENGEKR